MTFGPHGHLSRRTVTTGLLTFGAGLVAATAGGFDTASAATTGVQVDALAEPATSFPVTVAAYLRTRPGTAAVMGFNLSTGASVAYRSAALYPTASIVKVDILAALLLQAQDKGRALTTTEKTLARAMITRSDNASASRLWTRIGRGTGLRRANQRLHLTDTVPGPGTTWGLTRTSCRDQVKLLWSLTDSGSPLSPDRRQYALGLMQQVVSAQRWGVGAAGTGGTSAVKNGWLPYSADDRRWIVNSIGRVRLSNGTVGAIAVLSRYSPSMSTGVATAQRLAKLAAAALV